MRNLIYVLIALFIFGACSDDDNDNDNLGNAVLGVRLTDAPADYQKVLVDIEDVMINTSGENDTTGWESLDIMYPGVYNLLDFTNGIDTLLVEKQLPAGRISQVRLVLGEDNQLKANDQFYDLQTPSAQSSGLKFNVHQELIEGLTYTLWIDFDAGRSIVDKGNGTYSLKPVIRAYTEASDGAITGVVDPVDAHPYIMAISESNDTTGTYADTISGEYILGGLDAGTYVLEYDPIENYMPEEVADVNVLTGQVTELDTVRFEMQ